MKDLKGLRKVDSFEILQMLKDEGIIIGSVVINSQRLLKKCHQLGVLPNELKFIRF
jgi:hypothetical protein